MISSSATRSWSGFSIWFGEKATFSRISTVAVLWERPTTIMFIGLKLPLEGLFRSLKPLPGDAVLHAEVGKQENSEPDDREQGGAFPPPTDSQATMKQRGINQPGN